jgi:hypothetical protein
MTNCIFTPHSFYVGYLFNGTATFLNCSNVFGDGLTMGGVCAGGWKHVHPRRDMDRHQYLFGPGQPFDQPGCKRNREPDHLQCQRATRSNRHRQLRNRFFNRAVQRGINPRKNLSWSRQPAFQRNLFSIDGAQVSMPELHIVQGTGMVNVANGTLAVPVVSIGETNTATGALNITGGTTLISTSLTVGGNSFASAGVSVSGGALNITNATHTATTMMNGGSLLLGAGAFQTDNLILTNGGSVAPSVIFSLARHPEPPTPSLFRGQRAHPHQRHARARQQRPDQWRRHRHRLHLRLHDQRHRAQCRQRRRRPRPPDAAKQRPGQRRVQPHRHQRFARGHKFPDA